jgi:hypothetical protein
MHEPEPGRFIPAWQKNFGKFLEDSPYWLTPEGRTPIRVFTAGQNASGNRISQILRKIWEYFGIWWI